MPKKRWHVAPCGAMYWFKNYSLEDFGKKKSGLIAEFERKEFYKILHPANLHKSTLEWQGKVYAMIIREIFEMMVDEMMLSNRIILSTPKAKFPIRMYIGKRVMKKNHRPRPRRKPLVLNEYGVILEGVTHNYYFRMKRKRTEEMKSRILNGQQFH